MRFHRSNLLFFVLVVLAATLSLKLASHSHEEVVTQAAATAPAVVELGEIPGPSGGNWSDVATAWQAQRQADATAWYAAVAENQRRAAQRAAQAAQRAQARPARSAPAVQPPSASGSVWDSLATGAVNGFPCGGQLPTCRVLACESGGNPTADNPNSSASGLWQFLDSTWAGYGGYDRAKYAPASVQNELAAAIWNGGSGQSHWAACL